MSQNTAYYETGQNIVPDCIVANEGEIPVRQYNIAELRSPLKLAKAQGKLQVTNKRMIFRAAGTSIMGKTALQYEFNMSEIGGVEIRKDWKIGLIYLLGAILLCSIIGAIVGGICILIKNSMYQLGNLRGLVVWSVFVIIASIGLCILAIFCYKNKHKIISSSLFSVAIGLAFGTLNFTHIVVYYLLIIIGVIEIILCLIALILLTFKPNLVIKIKTKGAGGAIEICRNRGIGIFALLFGRWNSEAEQYTGYSYVMPSDDTDLAIKELGAMIHDIQTLGDYGVEKWKTKKTILQSAVTHQPQGNNANIQPTQSQLVIEQQAQKQLEELVQKLSIELLIPMEEADEKAKELLNINPKFMPYIEAWVSGKETVVKFQGITTKMIMNKDKCTYPEALIRMDFLMNNPTYISEYVKNDI